MFLSLCRPLCVLPSAFFKKNSKIHQLIASYHMIFHLISLLWAIVCCGISIPLVSGFWELRIVADGLV